MAQSRGLQVRICTPLGQETRDADQVLQKRPAGVGQLAGAGPPDAPVRTNPRVDQSVDLLSARGPETMAGFMRRTARCG